VVGLPFYFRSWRSDIDKLGVGFEVWGKWKRQRAKLGTVIGLNASAQLVGGYLDISCRRQ
jgi:hypothetical protein